MKTDVIHLEDFDDIDSIRDRLEWSKSDRIVLVWPKRGEIEINQVEMILLARKAEDLGLQIAIVTGSGSTREMAASAGIGSFNSQVSATLARWPSTLPSQIPQHHDNKDLTALRDRIEQLRFEPERKIITRLLYFSAGVTAVFALILFFLPGATIRLTPARIDQSLDLTIQANPSIKQADITGKIPLLSASNLQNVKEKIETSGQLLIADQYAVGKVSLENLTEKTIQVPEGTIITTLSDPPIRFEITNPVEVQPDNKPVTVDIRAVLPGSNGNIAAEEIQSVEGSLGPDLAVKNDEPTVNGGESSLRSPSDDDIRDLREKIKSALLAQARKEFGQTKKSGQTFFEKTIKIEKVVDENISTPAGEPADFLEIGMTAEVSILYIEEDDIKTSIREALNTNIPKGYEPENETIVFTTIGEPEFDPDTVSLKWEIQAARKLRSTYSTNAIVQATMGKTPRQALVQISAMMHHQALPQIQIFPTWWPRLPYIPFRIEVISQ
jgi:hypothetical protein